ncbi:redoxin domain-containing protein [Candidatus Sumerlaeota bacterium]|nr:redoxin domain-containing protein [Candidatus Sumerlaeota bacterium]
MKKSFLLSCLFTAAFAVGTTVTAFADSGCQTACSAAAAEKLACADNGAAVEMDKGGAAKDNVAEGYKLGQKVPNFTLKDTEGKEHSLADLNKDKVVVLVFFNQSCPFVQEMESRLNTFAKDYSAKGVSVVAIDAGVNNQLEDIAKKAKSSSFPILVNPETDLAQKFNAARTPEVFLLDKNGVIQYHGMFDNGEKGAEANSRKSPAQDAVDAVLAGKEVALKETEAFGCKIKLKKVADSKGAAEKKEDKKS